MIASTSLFARLFFSITLCSYLLAATTTITARAQGFQTSAAPQEAEDVLRINTELVQTDVLVLDKQGRFVDNLQREQFELRVDGKPQAFSFFERVRTGSADEEAQLAAARGIASTAKGAPVHPLDRGRTLIFFIDDVHLSADSLARARKVVLRFINEEMGANDEAIIASTSGQIGFLQQLTNNKAVLRAALARLNFRQHIRTKGEFPEITEYQAFAIQERNDQQLFDYFVAEVRRDDVLLRPEIAQTIVRNRVQMIVNQSNFYVLSALSSLENFMRSSSQIPGRKLFYFISDGFLLNIKSGNIVERLRHITDAALRSGAVIYSIDARGLASEPVIDASRQSFDLRGVVALRSFGDLTSTQEPLHKLAEDTGGRALLNNNALGSAISQALKETSAYYLLAWQPESAQRRGAFRQIEASIKGRPDLKVLVQRGYFDTPPNSSTRPATAKKKKVEETSPALDNTPDAQLMRAVVSRRQQTALLTSLSVGYTKEPNVGMILTASVEINDDVLANSDALKPAQNSIADLLGVVLNDQGKVVNSFKQQLTITPAVEAAKQRH
nr:VWA domain-containing protein [Acidobacteriota bacterium]